MLFDEDDLNPKYIDSLTKLAKEIRESLKYMLEFKGQLVHKRQDTIIVAQMQVVQEVLAQQHPQVWLDIKKQMEDKLNNLVKRAIIKKYGNSKNIHLRTKSKKRIRKLTKKKKRTMKGG